MPYLEITNTSTDSSGQSGSFVDPVSGQTINYSLTGAGGALTGGFGDIDGSNIHIGDTPSGAETLNLSFTSLGLPVSIDGVRFSINATNTTEVMDFTINGINVNLNSLIADGSVTKIVNNNQTSINVSGDLVGLTISGNPDTYQFNFPISTMQVAHNGAANGSLIELYVDTDGVIICLGRGTLINTRSGEVAVEDLRAGDMVLTLDAGYQPIRWIGGRKVSAAEMRSNPKLKPIRICADALGPGLPKQDLLVSPQHRVLVRSTVAAHLFGSAEVLLAAKKLLELPGIYVEEGDDGVEYFHILFDAHQLVWSNGAVTESLFTGPEALKSVSPEAREEIAALFPEILEPDFTPVSVRPIPKTGKEIRKLVERIARQGKSVQAATPSLPSVS